MKECIFISSAQKELAAERRAVRDYIRGDALFRRFFDVFLFEDLPASDRRADDVYLDEVDRCAVYVGLFGDSYGSEGPDGLSPTEREFDRATAKGKKRLVFVKSADDSARQPKMQTLIHKANYQLIRRRFESISELTTELYASLVDVLQDRGVIQSRPFDDTLCPDATVDDLDAAAFASFMHQARTERQFPLDERAPMPEVLTHLGLFRDDQVTNAAVLLFGRNPQRLIPCAEVRCMHFHGTEVVRPAPFNRIFKGNLFSQVDQAANFVLSVTNLSVGTRALGPRAPVVPEIPPDVVREAVVNAVAHRDYSSSAAVQVAVFADRIEVWNPGELLSPLTPESLRHPHRSVARNHRICEALFQAGYIEKYGTGTLMMIRESLAHSLPEPGFEQRGGEFSAVIWRDWLTEKVLSGLNLNDRQARAILVVKTGSRLDNNEYQKLFSVSKPTASRDLDDLVEKGALARIGTTGQGTHYILGHKGIGKGSKGSSSDEPAKGSQRAQTAKTHKRDRDETVPSAPPQSAPLHPRLRKAHSAQLEAHAAGEVTPEVAPEVTPEVARLLPLCVGPRTRKELQEELGLSDEKHFRTAYLQAAMEQGYLAMTVPDRPTSRSQKYRLTEKARAWLASQRLTEGTRGRRYGNNL